MERWKGWMKIVCVKIERGKNVLIVEGGEVELLKGVDGR